MHSRPPTPFIIQRSAREPPLLETSVQMILEQLRGALGGGDGVGLGVLRDDHVDGVVAGSAADLKRVGAVTLHRAEGESEGGGFVVYGAEIGISTGVTD